ncbi:MAG: C40 family peptidase, partial [Spirochaetaceae bacterium]|nr:C40 family peptidase [Spirochaetaceae bacterium]
MRKIALILSLCCFIPFTVMAQRSSVMIKSSLDDPRGEFVKHAKTFLGVPYSYGGMSRDGLDCSGFVNLVTFEAFDVALPRSAAQLFAQTEAVSEIDKQLGDLVFFRTTGSTISHVGIYLGGNKFIHCASDGPHTGVIISSLEESYWQRTYVAARRILPSDMRYNEREFQQNFLLKSDAKETTKEAIQESPQKRLMTFEFSGAWDWGFINENADFGFMTRGGILGVDMIFSDRIIKPGIGTQVRITSVFGGFYVPLYLSVSIPGNFRFYTGCVFETQSGTLGNYTLSVDGWFYSKALWSIAGLNWSFPPMRL